jgi:hypothetical protein
MGARKLETAGILRGRKKRRRRRRRRSACAKKLQTNAKAAQSGGVQRVSHHGVERMVGSSTSLTAFSCRFRSVRRAPAGSDKTVDEEERGAHSRHDRDHPSCPAAHTRHPADTAYHVRNLA